jgi:uncharacterized protein YdeI (YjbR/CyaY-like superfamily)
MGRNEETLPTTTAADRAAWRAWLTENHHTAPGVWLVYYKVGSGTPSLAWAEAVQEALCFGWIDSKRQPIDAECFRQKFTPRRAGSAWSPLNKRYIAELTAAGLMAEAGLAAVAAAQADGSWDIERPGDSGETPDDLLAALDAHPVAAAAYAAYSASVRRATLNYVGSAARPETRARRIAEVIALAEQGKSLVRR